LDFRQRLIEKYDSLFSGGGESSEFGELASFGKRWGWYASIDSLAGGDIRRHNEITELNVHQCLMKLTFEKEKNTLEMKMIKRHSA